MPLPLIPIAAGVAARYGAKKLAKYLVKRNTKKANVKTKKLDEKKNARQDFMEKNDNMMDSIDNSYGTKEYTNIPKPYVSPKSAKNLKRIDRQHVEKHKKFTKKITNENTKKPYKYKTTLQSEKKGRVEIYTYDKITSPRHKKFLNTLKPFKGARPK